MTGSAQLEKIKEYYVRQTLIQQDPHRHEKSESQFVFCIPTFASHFDICFPTMTGWMTRTLWIFMTTHLSLIMW